MRSPWFRSSKAPTAEELALGVLVSSFSGVEVPDWLAAAVSAGLGAVCLYADNVPSVSKARETSDHLHGLGPHLCLAVDEEGGEVTRLQRASGSSLPGNAALGWLNDVGTTQRAGAALGRLVAAAGIDLNLAPCVDVASNPLNRVIGARSFSPYTHVASDHGRAFLDGLHSAGVGGCLKHFPGHGDTAVDSHLAVPQIDVSQERLSVRDVAPFAASPHADAVIVAHIRVPKLGPDPASISPWAYAWLRGLGFDEAVLMTDALGTQGLGGSGARGNIGEACVRALAAGADLCCLQAPMHRDPERSLTEAVEAIGWALASGRLSTAALTASVERNRAMTARLRARRGGRADDVFGVSALEELGLEIARRALLVRGSVRLRPGPAVFLDLRSGVNQVLGTTQSMLLDAVNQARRASGQDELQAVDPDALVAMITKSEVPEVVLQTREPLGNPGEADALAWTLPLVPDAVVVHTGMVSAAPLAQRLICTHGVSRPNGLAAAEALVGRTG